MRIYVFSVFPWMPPRSCAHGHFRRLREGSNTLDPITQGDQLAFPRHLLLVSLGLRPGVLPTPQDPQPELPFHLLGFRSRSIGAPGIEMAGVDCGESSYAESESV